MTAGTAVRSGPDLRRLPFRHLVVAATGFTTLFAVLFNLICDLTGGIRLTVLELEPSARQSRRAAATRRRGAPRGEQPGRAVRPPGGRGDGP